MHPRGFLSSSPKKAQQVCLLIYTISLCSWVILNYLFVNKSIMSIKLIPNLCGNFKWASTTFCTVHIESRFFVFQVLFSFCEQILNCIALETFHRMQLYIFVEAPGMLHKLHGLEQAGPLWFVQNSYCNKVKKQKVLFLRRKEVMIHQFLLFHVCCTWRE